jgi:hypothetical protein
MTKKDYEAIAKSLVFSEHMGLDRTKNLDWRVGYNTAINFVANELAVVFEDDNPRFDRDRFLEACGL